MTLTFTGTIDGNTIKGAIGGHINGDFTGTRPDRADEQQSRRRLLGRLQRRCR